MNPYDPLSAYTFAEIVVSGRAMMTHPFLMVPRTGEIIALPRPPYDMVHHSSFRGAVGEVDYKERRPRRARLRVEGVVHLMEDSKPGAHVQLHCTPMATTDDEDSR